MDLVVLLVEDVDGKIYSKPSGCDLDHGVGERRNGPTCYGGHNLWFGTPGQTSW